MSSGQGTGGSGWRGSGTDGPGGDGTADVVVVEPVRRDSLHQGGRRGLLLPANIAVVVRRC